MGDIGEVHARAYHFQMQLEKQRAKVKFNWSHQPFFLKPFAKPLVPTDKADIAMRVSVEHDSGIESNRESLEISRTQHTTTTRPSFI